MKTILYQDREYDVYGWTAIPGLRDVGSVSFSCVIPLSVGSVFVLKETGEIFRIASANLNGHVAERRGSLSAAPKAVFLNN